MYGLAAGFVPLGSAKEVHGTNDARMAFTKKRRWRFCQSTPDN
jgi:hypothetical protein